MKSGARRRQWSWLGALLLAAFAAALVGSAFGHTDDGCEVEVHCLPCRWHQGTPVVFALVPQPSAPVELGAAHVDARAPAPLDGGCFETPSRAPPLA